jgi:hypothetical protein
MIICGSFFIIYHLSRITCSIIKWTTNAKNKFLKKIKPKLDHLKLKISRAHVSCLNLNYSSFFISYKFKIVLQETTLWTVHWFVYLNKSEYDPLSLISKGIYFVVLKTHTPRYTHDVSKAITIFLTRTHNYLDKMGTYTLNESNLYLWYSSRNIINIK